MRYLRKNTAVLVSVGPFFDRTDGCTIENSLTITNERITLVADTDDGSAPTIILDNVTGATSGTSNDLNYITGIDAGIMQLELSASNTNRNGRLLLAITDAANHVPVFHEFMVLPEAVYDSLVLGTDTLQADVTQFGGSNITSTGGRPEVNTTHIAGSAVSTSTAQIGVNVVNFGGSAGTFSSGRPEVNSSHISGSSTAADNAEVVFATDFATNYSTTTDKWQTEANVLQIEGSDATNQIRDSVVDDATRIDASALNTASVTTIPAILVDTAEIGAAGAGLTNINLPDQTMNITGNITGNLSGSVGGVASLDDGIIGQSTFNLGALALQEVGSVANLNGLTSLIVREGTIGNASATDPDLGTLGLGDDELNGLLIVIRDASANEKHSRFIDDFVGSTSVATLNSALPFTTESGVDTFVVYAIQESTGGGGGASASDIWNFGTRTLTALDEDSTTLDIDAAVRGAVGLASANLDTQLDALPTAGENADAVWDEDATAHQTQGTFGQAIGDPGADTDTIFGLVNTNLNATVGSRASQTSVDDLPTNSELTTALAGADDAVLAAIAALNNLSQANIRTAVGLATANLDTQLDALPTNAELATALGTADDAVLAAVAALNNLSSAQVQTAAAAALAVYATVAGSLDANIQRVNDVAVTGTGAEGDEWGP